MGSRAPRLAVLDSGGWRRPSPSGSSRAAPAPAADIEILEAGRSPGAVAPDFTLSDTGGTSVKLSDFAGKVILLTFWSCYTDTCFTTVKVFEDLLARLGPLGLVAPTVCEEIPPPWRPTITPACSSVAAPGRRS